jgi:hypothetical protein
MSVFCIEVCRSCATDLTAQRSVLLHSAPLIYRLTNDPVFNDVPLTIEMGQFAVDPEIQS